MSAIGLLSSTASRVIFEPSHRRLAICDLSSDPRLRSLPSARLSPCRSAVDSAASARAIINNRTQALVVSGRTQLLRTQVCRIHFYNSTPSLDAISYPGGPWRSTRTHHLLEICPSVTGTGFGSTANTGGFGSTNTTGGGLFGGGSTGFGGSGGTSTMFFSSGTFYGLDVETLSQAFMSIEQHWLPISPSLPYFPAPRMTRHGWSTRHTSATNIFWRTLC